MARTVRTKVYKFSELSDSAKEKAISGYRSEGNNDMEHCYDEAHESVKEFRKIFGTISGRDSWLDVRMGEEIDENLLNIKGLRLQKYIWNNYKNQLFSGKYYSTHGTYDANGKYHYKSRKSNCTIEHSCELTGVCYDESLLKPVYDFLNWTNPRSHATMDFEELINDCFHELKKDLDSEEEYKNTDEYISEEIEANEYEFTRDGKRF